MANFSNTDNNLSEGVEATHITPEQGNTASATTGGPSAAGTTAEGSPAPASGLGKRVGKEDRTFEGGDKTQDA